MSLSQTGAPVILAGEFNVAQTTLDIYKTRSYDDSALVHRACRERFDAMPELGLTDAFRWLHPGTAGYTFWDYRRNRWNRDAGLRLDYILVNDFVAMGLDACAVDREMRAQDNSSDHAPLCATAI